MKTKTWGKRLFIFCIVALIITSCRRVSLLNKSCPIEDLLIGTSDLPGDQWEEVGSRSYRDAPSKLGIDRIGTGFSTPFSGVVGEDIYRFRNEKDAEDGYNELANDWFHLEPKGTSWNQLNLPDDISINTVEYRLECSVRPNQKGKTCWYIARYENTIIEFKADMLIIKNEDLFHIIELIDQKVMKCSETQP
jgi:hypothetical protein